MTTFPCYIDPLTYVRSPSGLESASLVTNATYLSTDVGAGATTLSLVPPGLTTTLNLRDRVYLFDGPNSEVVTVTVSTDTLGVETIQCTATVAAHSAATTIICTDGPLGSLAEQIINASAWIESTCYQSLFLTTYTNEQLAMPTMRASINSDGELTFRPRHWPIQSVTGIAIAWTAKIMTTFDPTETFIDGNKRLCSIPNLVLLPGNQNQTTNIVQSPSRSRRGQVQVTYSAGFAANALPGDVKDAAILVTSDMLTRRQNPTGSDRISLGDKMLQASPRDTSGETNLIKRVRQILAKYSTELY